MSHPLRRKTDIRPSEPSTGKLRGEVYGTKCRILRPNLAAWNAKEMRRIYADRHSMASAIAADANVSVRTAEGWVAEPPKHPPGGVALSNLLANNAEYRRAYEAMLDGHAEHPDLERLVTQLVTKLVRDR